MDTSSLPRKIAAARIGFAATALLSPRAATLMLGGKRNQLTPLALGWVGFFASREAALGAVTLASESADPGTRRKVLLMNAAVDTLDSLSLLALAKRQRSLMPILVGLPGAALVAYTHFQAAQQIGSSSGGATTSYEPTYATA